MKIFKWLKNLVNPDIYQWCFKCKTYTKNHYRNIVWYGRIKKQPYCGCGARKSWK